MYQTILVPVDGSKRAEAILDHAENLAKRNGVRVVFIRVEEEPLMVVRDEADAGALYDLLEKEIIPLYYRAVDGLPKEWISIMKQSIKSNAPKFSARRMVKEYTKNFYIVDF